VPRTAAESDTPSFLYRIDIAGAFSSLLNQFDRLMVPGIYPPFRWPPDKTHGCRSTGRIWSLCCYYYYLPNAVKCQRAKQFFLFLILIFLFYFIYFIIILLLFY